MGGWGGCAGRRVVWSQGYKLTRSIHTASSTKHKTQNNKGRVTVDAIGVGLAVLLWSRCEVCVSGIQFVVVDPEVHTVRIDNDFYENYQYPILCRPILDRT